MRGCLRNVGLVLSAFDLSGNLLKSFPVGYNFGDVVRVGDLNGDGFADVVFMDVGSGQLSIFPGNDAPANQFIHIFPNAPADQFIPSEILPIPTGGPFDMTVCDLDHDGLDDIVTSDLQISTRSALTRESFFGSRTAFFDPTRDKFACADLNHDGFDDLIIAHGLGEGSDAQGFLQIYSAPTLPPINFFPDAQSAPAFGIGDQIAAGDLDGDGFAEIVIARPGAGSTGRLEIYSAPGKTPPALPVPAPVFHDGDAIAIPRPNPTKPAQSSFVVPFIPEAIVYEMPGDKSKASYGQGSGLGTSTVWTNTTTLSQDVSFSETVGILTGTSGATFSSSTSMSNGVNQSVTSSSSIAVGFSDKTLNPKHDVYFLAMNVPGIETDRGASPPQYGVTLAGGTLINLSAEQLQGLAQSPPDLSLFEPGQLQPSFVGATTATLTDLIKPEDAQALLALDPQIQGQDITQNPDRFVRAQIPNPAGDGTFIPATVPMLAPPLGSGTTPSITETTVTANGSSTGTGQTMGGSFKVGVGIKINADEATLGVTETSTFQVSFSKVTTTTISSTFAASVTVATDDSCTSGTVDLYLDQVFGTYVSVPHLTNLCAPTIGTQSFENLGQWTMGGGSAMLSNIAADGQFSFNVTGTNWTTLTSNPLNSAVLRALASSSDLSKISYALQIPTNQPNPYWTGNTQMYLSAPSANVYNAYLGQVQLTGLPQGSFQRMEFAVPDYALPALTGNNADVTFTIVLNVNPGPGGWLVDDLRIGK